MHNSCNKCFYKGDCSDRSGKCEYYTPNDEYNDHAVVKMTEIDRAEYYSAWLDYIKEDDENFDM